MNNNSDINLQKLTDKQKVWLTQLSYINLTKEGLEKLKTESLTISEFDKFLDKPNSQMYGNILGNKNEPLSKSIADAYIGRKDSLITKKQLLQELKNLNLGNLSIIDITNDSKTGFQAIAFKDQYDNIGISYRGSDCEWENGGLKDWALADLGEFLTNDSKQIHQAIDFFNKHKHTDGNNYLYGHSLGGNLTAHTYLKKHKEITQAFSYNGLPIHQSLLNTKEKIQAFNEPKFICAAVAGDILQHIKKDDLYSDKVIFIKNNKTAKPSLLSAHLPQANTYDENDNFVIISRKEAWKELSSARQIIASLAKNLNTIVGSIHDKKNKEEN